MEPFQRHPMVAVDRGQPLFLLGLEERLRKLRHDTGMALFDLRKGPDQVSAQLP